jgi:hypothetical protein
VVKCKRKCDRHFKTRRVSISPHEQKPGGVVNTHNNPFPERQGFSTEDILWAVGVWSVTLILSPVILFYVLMVN